MSIIVMEKMRANVRPATDEEIAALEGATPVGGMLRIHPDKAAAYLARLRAAEAHIDAVREIAKNGTRNTAAWHEIIEIVDRTPSRADQ